MKRGRGSEWGGDFMRLQSREARIYSLQIRMKSPPQLGHSNEIAISGHLAARPHRQSCARQKFTAALHIKDFFKTILAFMWPSSVRVARFGR
eukprot:2853979-Pleurochrysis_carterae.AAC.2